MARQCPEHRQPMQVLRVPGEGDQALELDRCAACGGLWLDYGELEAVLGAALESDALPGADTSRRCPDCQLTLTPLLLGRGVPVETCSACRGLWLDEEDLFDLDDARLAELACATPKDGGAAPAATFECAKCATECPIADASGTSLGLVCRACTPTVHTEPGVSGFGLQTAGVEYGALSLLSLVLRFVR